MASGDPPQGLKPPENAEPATAVAGVSDVDWETARSFLRRQLAKALDRVEPAVIEDLTQEAAIRLLRAVRREGARNLEALMTTVARRTRIDFIRHRRCWSAVLTPLDETVADVPDPARSGLDGAGDPLERLEFMVLEFFRSCSAPCLQLAEFYFSEQDWRSVSNRVGLGYEAVRKQWSRCVEKLRAHARLSEGFLAAWAQSQG